MMRISLSTPRGLMLVRLSHELSAEDFCSKAMPAADRMMASCGAIPRLFIDVRDFYGWESTEAVVQQIEFLRSFHRDIHHVALFGDRHWRGAMPALAWLFVSSELRLIEPGDRRALRIWLSKRVSVSPQPENSTEAARSD